jgi:hypothetical protein
MMQACRGSQVSHLYTWFSESIVLAMAFICCAEVRSCNILSWVRCLAYNRPIARTIKFLVSRATPLRRKEGSGDHAYIDSYQHPKTGRVQSDSRFEFIA